MRKDLEIKPLPSTTREFTRVKVKHHSSTDHFITLSDDNTLHLEHFESGKLIHITSVKLDQEPIDFNLDEELRLLVLYHHACVIYKLERRCYTHLQSIPSPAELFIAMSQSLKNSIVLAEGPKFSLYSLRYGVYSYVRSDVTTDQTSIHSVILYLSDSLKIAVSTLSHIHVHDHRSGVLVTSLRIPAKAISILPNPSVPSVLGMILKSGHVMAYDTRYPHSPIFSSLVATNGEVTSALWLPGQPNTLLTMTNLGEVLFYQPHHMAARLIFSTEAVLPLFSFEQADNSAIDFQMFDIYPLHNKSFLLFSEESTKSSILKFKEGFYYDMTPALPKEIEVYHCTDFSLPSARNQDLFNRLKNSLWDNDVVEGPNYADYFDLTTSSASDFNDLTHYIHRMKTDTLPPPIADSAHRLYKSFARALYRKDINMACKLILQRLHHLAEIDTSLALQLIKVILTYDIDDPLLIGKADLLNYASLLNDTEAEIEAASEELRTKLYCGYYSLSIIEDIKKGSPITDIAKTMTDLGDLLVKCPIAVEENLFTELVSLLTPAFDKPFINFLFKLAPVTPQNRLGILGAASAPVLLPSIYMDMPSDVQTSILDSFKALTELSDDIPASPDLSSLRKYIPKTYGFVGKKSQEVVLVEHDLFSSHFLQQQLRILHHYNQGPSTYKLDAFHVSVCIVPLLASLYNYISSDAFGHTGTIIRAHIELINNDSSSVSALLTSIIQDIAWPRYLKLARLISKSDNINLLTNALYQFAAFTRSSTQIVMIPQSVLAELTVIIPILVKNLLNLPNPKNNIGVISELHSALTRLRTKRIGAKSVETVLSNAEVMIEEWLEDND